jgi:KDO2-lipid IV(A) lauroyltransferase
MSKGLGSFHYLKQSPVLFTTCTYQGDCCLLEFQRLECPHSSDKERDLQQTSQAFTTAMEASIRRHPEQYFWMHRRWRKRPACDPQPVY